MKEIICIELYKKTWWNFHVFEKITYTINHVKDRHTHINVILKNKKLFIYLVWYPLKNISLKAHEI